MDLDREDFTGSTAPVTGGGRTIGLASDAASPPSGAIVLADGGSPGW